MYEIKQIVSYGLMTGIKHDGILGTHICCLWGLTGMKIFSIYTDFSFFVSFSADFIVSYCYNLHFFLYFQPELGLFTLVSWGFLSFLEHFQCFSTKAIFMSGLIFVKL